mgnify:CR=1 FL=1
MDSETTYVFENGKMYTLVQGKIVEAVGEEDYVNAEPSGQGPVEMPAPPEEVSADLGIQECPECGAPGKPGDSFCAQCGSPLGGADQDREANPADYPQDYPSPGIELGGEAGPYMASTENGGANQYTASVQTISTPNGLEGRVLTRTAGLWNDEVTVRLANGNIVHLPVNKEMKFASVAEETVDNPVDALDVRLAARVDGGDRADLEARKVALEEILSEAQSRIAGTTDSEAARLNTIMVQASYEAREVADAIQHIAELEGQAYRPPAAPFSMTAVEQASVGAGDGSWLDATVNEAIKEANERDYEKIMNEGPEAFVAALDDAAVANAGTTRSMAESHIISLTAGADEGVRDRYRTAWLARVEEQRRAQHVARKAKVTEKEAAVEEEDYSNLPAEFGFGA